jgi:hypothetical protein
MADGDMFIHIHNYNDGISIERDVYNYVPLFIYYMVYPQLFQELQLSDDNDFAKQQERNRWQSDW